MEADIEEQRKKVALQEDIRKEQEEQYKKLLKQKDVELQIIHEDYEQKFKSAFLDQSMDNQSQTSDMLSQKLRQSETKSKRTKKSKISKTSKISHNLQLQQLLANSGNQS